MNHRERYSEAVQAIANGTAHPVARKAMALLDSGFTLQETAKALGYTYKYVQLSLSDPTRIRDYIRKHRYKCETCGGPVYSANNNPARFCQKCAGLGYAFWTKETIVQAIREYNARYGRPPGAMDWNVAMARKSAWPERLEEIEKRWEEGLWPVTTQVLNRWGSWNNAIEAAGFKACRPGERRDPERWRRNRSAGQRSND